MSEPKQSDSLIAAIEGNRAGMSHADLVLTCDMLERGRATWRKECEEAQRENQRLRDVAMSEALRLGDKDDCIAKLMAERDQWKKCAKELSVVLKTAWQHRCSDGVGGCEAVSESASESALEGFDKLNA